MIDPKRMNKIDVLDSCVDGDEARFDNLIGIDFPEFNIIYDIIKRNSEVLSSNLKCCYLNDGKLLEVRVPTSEKNMTKMSFPVDTNTNIIVSEGELIISIPVTRTVIE